MNRMYCDANGAVLHYVRYLALARPTTTTTTSATTGSASSHCRDLYYRCLLHVLASGYATTHVTTTVGLLLVVVIYDPANWFCFYNISNTIGSRHFAVISCS